MKTIAIRFLAVLLLTVTTSGAFAQIARAPLVTAAPAVPPNFIFTLDDSGSMNLECQNDSQCEGNVTVGSVPYVTSSYAEGVATYDSNNLFNRQMRSSQVNGLYYDPAVRYQPWIRGDGTRYGNSTVTAAPFTPLVPTRTINLSITQTFVYTNNSGFCTGLTAASCSRNTQTFYIPQYFTLTPGGSSTTVGSFTQTIIQGATSTYAKASGRTDCSSTTCTQTEELQNFANWFTYYRNRILAAIGSTSEAFQDLPATYRLGYGRINAGSRDIDGFDSPTIIRGVRPFTGTDRNEFYTWLQSVTASGGTPLPRAMGDVGEYFSRSDNRGPWSNTPGSLPADATPHLACRRSYHLLTTDGVWSSGSVPSNTNARLNVDNTTGPTINGPNGQVYLNTAARPYSDAFAGTLADVASYYWKNDLRPDLANLVPTNGENPAFWQNMVNYTVAFGLSGLRTNPTDLPALTAGTLQWGDATSSSLARIDDLWHAAINSRGRAFSAQNPAAFAEALRSIVANIEEREGSEAGVAVSGRQLTSNTRKYVPEYRTGVWSGKLSAIPLDINAEGDTPVWQAADSMPLPADRNIYTYKDSTTRAVTFTWAGLTAAGMTSTLNVSTAEGTGLVAYLRGSRAGEGTTYRTRAGVLGDIVNSSPALVRDSVDMQYDFLPNGTPGRNDYRLFLNRKTKRIGEVFVGANDGMLHVFSDVNGTETFAFMPRAVLGNVRFLANSPYDHRYYVDGPLLETDVYDASGIVGTSGVADWKNIVVGGGGAGAKNLFAVNAPVATTAVAASITTPVLMPPGPNDILWEVSSADANFSELGYVLHTPEAGLMRDGSWVIVSGNGYESTSRKAQLFIINALTGALIKRIDTGVGVPSTAPNGLGGVRVVRDPQQRIVSAYAGDLLGNMWKFDLSGNTVSSWNVAFGSSVSNPRPLYTARNRLNEIEPITAAPTYVLHPLGGVMVLAGSGKLFEDSDRTSDRERTLYGMWDRVPIGSDSSTATGVITGTVSLVLQTISSTVTLVTGTGASAETDTYYGISQNRVDYGDSTVRGWRLPLTIQVAQRLISDPQVFLGRVFFETLVPGSAAVTCQSGGLGIGYNYVIDPLTGAVGTSGATFDTNGDGVINNSDNASLGAYATRADGSDAVLIRQNGPPSTNTVTGSRSASLVGSFSTRLIQGSGSTIRRSWRQITNPPF